MAEIRIAHVGGKPVPAMPAICMRCGWPSEGVVRRRFIWQSPWLLLLICAPCGLIWLLIAYLALSRRVRVEVPLCRKHRSHWLWRRLVVLGGFLIWVDVIFAINLLYDLRAIPDAADPWIAAITISMILGWLVTWFVLAQTRIRVLRIDDNTLHLTGVAPEFVRALGDAQMCVKCGYDLKGNVSGVCPECGAPTPAGQTAPSPALDRLPH